MAVNKAQLIAQIIQSEGLTGDKAKARTTSLEKMQLAQLQAMSDKIQQSLSNSNAQSVGFKNFVELPAAQATTQPQATQPQIFQPQTLQIGTVFGAGIVGNDGGEVFGTGFVGNDGSEVFGGGIVGSNNNEIFGLKSNQPEKKPVYNELQSIAMNFLEGNLNSAKETMVERENEAGALSWCVNSWKEIFDKELAKSAVKSKIDATTTDIELLKKAAGGEFLTTDFFGETKKISFEETFQKQRGVKFSQANIEDCAKKADTFTQIKAANTMFSNLKAILNTLGAGNVTSQFMTQEKSQAVFDGLKLCGVEKRAQMDGVLADIEKKFKDSPTIQQYGGQWQFAKEGNKYKNPPEIVRMASGGNLMPITNEQYKIIGDELNLRLNRAYANTIDCEIPKNATNKQIEDLTQKKFNYFQKEYENSFAKAYGKKDLKALSERYVEAQQKGVENIEMVINISSMALMVAPGGVAVTANWGLKGALAAKNSVTFGGIAKGIHLVDKARDTVNFAQKGLALTQKLSPVIMSNMIARPTYLTEQLTSGNGMSQEEWRQWGAGVLQNSAYMALGMGAGKLAEQGAAMYKTKALVNTLKNSGRSADEIATMIKTNPVKFPKDIVQSFSKINTTAKLLQVPTEVALDLGSTYALNKAMNNGELRTQDWVNSLMFAINGSMLQKQFKPLTKEAKAEFLTKAFQEYGMTKDEAFNVLKTMDDISSGKIRVKNTKSTDVNQNTSGKSTKLPEVVISAPAAAKSKAQAVEIENKFQEIQKEFNISDKAMVNLKENMPDPRYFDEASKLITHLQPEEISTKKDLATILATNHLDDKINFEMLTMKNYELYTQECKRLNFDPGDGNDCLTALSESGNIETLLKSVAAKKAIRTKIQEFKDKGMNVIDFSNKMKNENEIDFAYKKLTLANKLCDDPNFPKEKIGDILYRTNEINITLANKLCDDPNFPKEKICYILYHTNEANITLANKLCDDPNFPKDQISYILSYTKEINITLANKLCDDPNFPKDQIGSILYRTNKENITLANKLCDDPNFPKERIGDILYRTNKENITLANKLCDDPNFPKEQIHDILNNTNKENITLANKLCDDPNFPKDQIGSILYRTNEENITLANKLCDDPNFPKDQIGSILYRTNKENITLANKLCDDPNFPKDQIGFILSGTKEINITLANKLYDDPNFPKDQISSILNRAKEINITLANKLCDDPNFPKDQISDILCYTNEKNITLANKLCDDPNFPKEKIGYILNYTKEINITLANKLCDDPNFPKDQIGYILFRTNKENITLANKLCDDPNFPKEQIGDILCYTKEINITLANKLCDDPNFPKEKIGDILNNTNEINIALANKLCDDPNFPKEKIGSILFRTKEKNFININEVSYELYNKRIKYFEDKGIELDGSNLFLTLLSEEQFEKFEHCRSEAFLKRAQLKSAVADLTDDDINDFFFDNSTNILTTIDMLDEATFIHSYSSKITGVKEITRKCAELENSLSSENMELLKQKFAPEKSQKYQTLQSEISTLKKTFPEVQKQGAEALNMLKNEINTKTQELRPLQKGINLDPKSKLQKTRTLAMLANDKNIEKFIDLVQTKTPENEAAWAKAINQKIFDTMGIPYEEALSIKLNLTENKYLSEILSGNSDFRENFKDLVQLIQENPDKSVKDILDALPQNQQTKEMFEQIGVNYDKWVNSDKNSFVTVKVETSADAARQAAIEGLEAEFNDSAFKALPKEETDKIFKALEEQLNVTSKEVEESVWDNDGFEIGKRTYQRLFHQDKPIEFEQLEKTISIIKKEINTNEFWSQKTNDQQINACRETMYSHLVKERDIQIKNASALKLDEVAQLEVRKTDMNNIQHALFLGNHGSCCTAVGTGCNQFSAPTYVMNKMISAIEVVDGKEFVGNTMCYIAEVDGKTALVLDNIELNAKYHKNDKIREAMFEYARKMCAEIGQPDMPIYAGPDRHKLNMEHLRKESHEMRVIGSSGEDDIYLDFITSGREVDGTTVDNVKLYKIR